MNHLKIVTAISITVALSGCEWLGSTFPGVFGVPGGNVAVVNGKAIPTEDFEAYLKYKNLKPKTDAQRQRMLDEFLRREALTRVISQQKGFDSAAVQAELDDQRREILINRYFDGQLNQAVDGNAIRSYYDNHQDEFAERKVHLAHILVRLNRTMNEQDRQVRLTKAREAYSKVHRGDDFAEVARQYSEDAVSAKKGGDLGWMREGAVDPAFSSKAFSLEPGQISEPFETPFGYHVLKVLEAPTVIRQPFEAVKGRIRHQLRNQAKEREVERLLSQIDVVKPEAGPTEK